MAKKMLIDATHAEETRVVVVDGTKVEEFDFESLNRRQLAGNIYLAKVTRVEPSLQAAFVDYGGNRHGFLAFSEVHPDYYQIPKADREALLAEEAALAREEEEAAAREKPKPKPRGRTRGSRRAQPAAEGLTDAADVAVADVPAEVSDPDERAALAEPAELPEPPELEDVPPPSAAGGGIDIVVHEEPAELAPEDEAAGYESVGGDDVAEERAAPRRPKLRRYKIQEVIKVRQILLVQVVKEERGNKGAALTTYLSLAGRYCVLMPNTARGGGISRKITNAADRKKLKEISSSITVPDGAGLIIRTAGANRTKTEIKRDYEYLLRQWEQIRDLTLKSIAPAPIYEEGSLIKRAIRDLYSRDIDEIMVDGERGYREAKDYMKMLMPSHAKNVKHYADPLPLFSRYQVESYLSAMFNPVVQLKSGGYIVIDVTEALVAIDVNSGRATREASIEETALKTNLEAAEEAARQMRLRDLAGLIVIDFIDMEDRRNNAAVEKKLKERLKSDRARIQVGRISPFGLLEMSRQRLRPGMIEATTKACPHCHGTGRVRSDDSLALALLREIEEEGVRQRSKEVLIVAPVDIANYLLNQKREHIAMIESRFGLSVRVEGDPALISPDYRLERFKTASRVVPAPQAVLPSVAYPEEEIEEEAEEEAPAETQEKPGKRKRRRRRRGGKGAAEPAEAGAEAAAEPEEAPAEPAEEPEARARPKSRRRSRGGRGAPGTPAPETSPFGEVIDVGDEPGPGIVDVPEADAPQRRTRERVRKPVTAVLAEAASAVVEAVKPAAAPAEPAEPEAATEPAEPEAPAAPETAGSAGPEPQPEPEPEPEPEKAPGGPKRRGWWSRAIGGS
jgi:ribonuclease E